MVYVYLLSVLIAFDCLLDAVALPLYYTVTPFFIILIVQNTLI